MKPVWIEPIAPGSRYYRGFVSTNPVAMALQDAFLAADSLNDEMAHLYYWKKQNDATTAKELAELESDSIDALLLKENAANALDKYMIEAEHPFFISPIR